ncbi:MAG: SDR family oxidoreductase [Chloroflexota bacterium]|nr:SDR family oxidoreductase [Chloroflexota bacterium]
MRGKVCVVTGATSGIGAETAKQLAQRGATVIIVGRSAENCKTTVARIRRETGNAAVEYLLADLSSQKDIRGLAQQFKSKYARLDVLVNNAGGFWMSRQETVDGYEMTFALNHLGYFLLTNLLLDMLIASAPARIVNVASALHWQARMDFNDLQGKRGLFNGLSAYNQSKLANVLFTYELARRFAQRGAGVTANALHPGGVRTNLIARNGGFFKWVAQPLFDLQAISAEQGAQTSVYLATSPDVEGVSGKYFGESKPHRSSPASYDEAAARRLWQVSTEMTGIPAA